MQTVRTNLKNNASTQYSNFDFQSMIVFNGVILGAGPSGLRKLCCGSTDAGTAIASYFIPATSNFGLSGDKRVIQAYFDFECSGSMQISLTGDGKTTIGPFTVTANSTEGAQRRRVTFGRGLKWSYAKVKVENVSGSSFSIDNIDLLLGEIPISGK